MHPSRILLSQARNVKPKITYPVEMTPLFVVVGVAIASGCFFTYRHFTYDKELRLWKNANLSELDQVLDKAERENKK
ncbi:hypothetical protein PVL30_000992 [Lodderomyces elongisporus]|uniref:uncharacterized protein n=1 Tax=Lodderomyces elongisporus TaxID=36914 RepID=UPI002924D287|nr:uncharacterized protein PVL30_000992 [Lodderomyces elongisporus]WLF77280.1 hypothetical protein PVL30_000992 [Lodderomyces elongisporus]